MRVRRMPRRNDRVGKKNARGRYALPREVYKAGIAMPTIALKVEALVLPDGRCIGRRPKIGYATEDKAMQALKQVRRSRKFINPAAVEKRVYRCPVTVVTEDESGEEIAEQCTLWHLSSREEFDEAHANRLYEQRQQWAMEV